MRGWGLCTCVKNEISYGCDHVVNDKRIFSFLEFLGLVCFLVRGDGVADRASLYSLSSPMLLHLCIQVVFLFRHKLSCDVFGVVC